MSGPRTKTVGSESSLQDASNQLYLQIFHNEARIDKQAVLALEKSAERLLFAQSSLCYFRLPKGRRYYNH
eukprot:12966-Eustigmatos_ZCMA.PRE.1